MTQLRPGLDVSLVAFDQPGGRSTLLLGVRGGMSPVRLALSRAGALGAAWTPAPPAPTPPPCRPRRDRPRRPRGHHSGHRRRRPVGRLVGRREGRDAVSTTGLGGRGAADLTGSSPPRRPPATTPTPWDWPTTSACW